MSPSGVSPSGEERSADEGKSAPPATLEDEEGDEITSPRVSGSALARLALATASSDRQKQVSLTTNGRGTPDKSLLETQRSEAPPVEPEDKSDDRAPTYPPPPAVLDLDSLAAEVDGNSERPPPIRRLGALEPALHLKPARVPSQLLDTLVSNTEVSRAEDLERPNRKS